MQYGRVVGKDCCVVFSASGFPYLILCTRPCKGKVATTFCICSTKPAAVKASTNYKKWNSALQSLRKKKIIFLLYITGAFSDMVKYFCE